MTRGGNPDTPGHFRNDCAMVEKHHRWGRAREGRRQVCSKLGTAGVGEAPLPPFRAATVSMSIAAWIADDDRSFVRVR
jgi:hypothetical protein